MDHRVTIPPQDFAAIPATLLARLKIAMFTLADLPVDFRPPANGLQDLGSAWLRNATSAVLAVPSALVPQEFNYLLNPRHKDFARLVLGAPEPFPFDTRLWR